MALKYQNVINDLKIENCPSNVGKPKEEMVVYRFSFAPIENEHNFLPNFLIDQIKGAPFNYKKCDETRKCLRCGTSFFLSRDKTVDKWNNLSIQFKENYGYTHIASGILKDEDGVMSEPSSEHFTFYENENRELAKQFKIIEEL